MAGRAKFTKKIQKSKKQTKQKARKPKNCALYCAHGKKNPQRKPRSRTEQNRSLLQPTLAGVCRQRLPQRPRRQMTCFLQPLRNLPQLLRRQRPHRQSRSCPSYGVGNDCTGSRTSSSAVAPAAAPAMTVLATPQLPSAAAPVASPATPAAEAQAAT